MLGGIKGEIVIEDTLFLETRKNSLEIADRITEISPIIDNLGGLSKSEMLPTFTTIELDADSQAMVRDELLKRNVDVNFRFMNKVSGISYSELNRIITSFDTRIVVYYKGNPLYSLSLNKGMFNPVVGPLGAKFIELILHREISVNLKNIIDLGCGSGNIGIAALAMGASKVLFTDINSNHLEILPQNTYLQSQSGRHEIMCQDLLSLTALDPEAANSYDHILTIAPTFSLTKKNSTKSDGLEADQSFYSKLSSQSHKILKFGGELNFWTMIPQFSPESLVYFSEMLPDYPLECWEFVSLLNQKDVGIFDDNEQEEGNFYMIFTIKKLNCQSLNSKESLSLKMNEVANLLDRKGYTNYSESFRQFAELNRLNEHA